jgi:ATP-dependent protease HslVU (ClpYQ) peptidase subunit
LAAVLAGIAGSVTVSQYLLKIKDHQMDTKNPKTTELAQDLAFKMREDFYLSKLAEQNDIEGAKTYSHDEAWK